MTAKASRDCWVSRSIPTTRSTAISTFITPTTRRGLTTTGRASRALPAAAATPIWLRSRASRFSWSSSNPTATTTPATFTSARTATSTSPPATAGGPTGPASARRRCRCSARERTICWARFCASTLTRQPPAPPAPTAPSPAEPITASRPAMPLPTAAATAVTKSGLLACATPGASASTVPTAPAGSLMWARASGKRSTTSHLALWAVSISAGPVLRAPTRPVSTITSTTTPSASRPAPTTCRCTSSRTAPVIAPSLAATSIAAPNISTCPAHTSTATTAGPPSAR